ncbi:peptidase M48-like protein [Dongia mobilis]|uniref:Peptidase M48-like protein n=1 Tax=Dongia mobilis TaxID=578943 RepID=A0A4R6WLD6_9PROT|nr:peptidase M48-like protein [Dongia mobilis]
MAEDRYYDGKTATAHRPLIRIEGEELVIASAEVAELDRWPFADIRVIDQNKVTGGMNFGRLSDPAPRLLLHDSPARQALLAAQPQLATWKAREAKRGFVVGATWTIVGLAIGAIAFFGWRHGAAALTQFVPKSWEKRVGEKVHKAVIEGFTLCKGEDGTTALRTLTDKLLPDGLEISLDVIDVKFPNALAIPGDHVVVTSGLIEMATSPDMVSGVLAHEIAHLELRHPTQGIISNLGVAATVSIILGGSGAGDLAYLAAILSYSREMETEADYRGIELLREAGLKSDGLAEFFKVLAEGEEEKGGGMLPDWLSTHPGLPDRAKYAATDGAGKPAMSDAEWQALRRICRKT